MFRFQSTLLGVIASHRRRDSHCKKCFYKRDRSRQEQRRGQLCDPVPCSGKIRIDDRSRRLQRVLRDAIVLQPQEGARIDAQLEVGELTQSVTVTEAVSQH